MPTFTIKFNIDPPNVQTAMDAINASLKNVGVSVENINKSKSGSALEDGFTKLGLRMQGVQQLFGMLQGTFGSFIAESNAGERSVAKLTKALQNQGSYSPTLLAELRAFADARQQATGIDEDATVAVMGQLTAMGLQGKALTDATVACQDLSSLMDGDMQGAVRVIADAFDGNTGMLKRYIKGLDESDIKQRGTISIIEQLTKAVGGQAVAMGDTGAGAIAKFDANWNDLKKSMGNILKDYLTPIVGWLSELVKTFVDGGPVMHTFALGVVSLAAAFTLLGTSMGGLPFIIGGVVTGAMMLIQWLGATQKEIKNTGETGNQARQELDRLSNAIAKLKSEAGKSSEIDELQKKIDKLQRTDEEPMLAGAYEAAKKKVKEYTDQLAEIDPVLQKVLAAERAGKSIYIEDIETAMKYGRIFSGGTKDRLTVIQELTVGQTAATKTMKQAELDLETFRKGKATDRKSDQLALEKTLGDGRVKEVERSKSAMELTLDNDEKTLLNKATTEEEKQIITAEYAVRRVELERDTVIAIARANILALESQKKVVANDPLKIKALQAQIDQINKDIAAAEANAGKKIKGVGLDTEGRDADRQKEIAAENKDYQQQKAIDKKRLDDKERDHDSYMSLIKKLDAAKKKQAADEKKYETETDKKKREVLKAQLDLNKEEIDGITATMEVKKNAAKQDILAGAQQFDASRNLGDQMKEMTRNTIKRLIAEAVANQIAKVIASLPFPFNIVVAPIAGLAVSALLEAVVPKFGGGGSVYGAEGVDKIPAMLTNKEFVVRREIAEPNRRFLEAMNAGALSVNHYNQGGSVGGSIITSGTSAAMDLKKEFAKLTRQLKKNIPQVNIFAENDMSKYNKIDRKLQRTRAAFAL